jgi:hypothetical protein
MMSLLVSCSGSRLAREGQAPDCPRFGHKVAHDLLRIRIDIQHPEMSRWIEEILVYCFVEEIEHDE